MTVVSLGAEALGRETKIRAGGRRTDPGGGGQKAFCAFGFWPRLP